jgi:UPF0148 protein
MKTDTMADKKPDDVMAEYLLKGAKMLATTCPACGSPLFTYKERTFCVMCELEQEKGSENKRSIVGKKADIPATRAGVSTTIPHGADEGGIQATVTYESRALTCALETTLISLSERIAVEPDPDRCLCLMNTVKKGIEALRLLSQP